MEETKNVNSIATTSPSQDSSNVSDADIAFDDIVVHEEGETTEEKFDQNESRFENREADSDNDTEKSHLVTEVVTDRVIALEDTEVDLSTVPCRSSNPSVESENTKIPPIILPEPTSGFVNNISVFCISQQGESHINNEIPCQDRSGFRWVNDYILITAIADGVGSCQLSHYGAETAVKSSLDYLEQYFITAIKRTDFVFDVPGEMKTALSGAMEYAYEEVEKKAQEIDVFSSTMQSTLTVTVYDGTTLYFAHAGDDGVVALNKDGVYAMVTSRVKGEEASSVFPLQSKQWYYGKVNDTVAFVMATDGVLDAFVRPESENNRVYYRFIEPVFYTSQKDSESAKSNCKDWEEYLKSPAYRRIVTDDITFVGVVNQKAIEISQKPTFDDNEWAKKSEEYEKKRRAALYPPQTPKSAPDKNNANESKGYGNTSTCAGTYTDNYGYSTAQSRGGSSNPYVGNAGSYSSQNVGGFRNPYTNNHGPYSYKSAGKTTPYSNANHQGHYSNQSGTQIPENAKMKAALSENKDIFVNGTKQTLSGVADMSVAVAATMFEVNGKVLSGIGELYEQAAETMKKNRLNKNQQKYENDDVNKNSSTDPYQ